MFTYTKKRKCINCATPIADQEHGLQKFCTRKELAGVLIKNCKDEYWSATRREEMAAHMSVAYFQRDQFEAVDSLYKDKGEIVSLEDLNRYGINLYRPVEFRMEDKRFVFYFHCYAVKQLPNNQFKISTHDLH